MLMRRQWGLVRVLAESRFRSQTRAAIGKFDGVARPAVVLVHDAIVGDMVPQLSAFTLHDIFDYIKLSEELWKSPSGASSNKRRSMHKKLVF